MAEVACGARANYLLSAVAPGAPNQGITVHGTEGSIAWVMGDRMSVAKVGQPLTAREPDPDLVREWRVEADFVDSIREGEPVTMTSFADGLKYMEFTHSVWTSWNEGRAVDVVSTAPPVARA